MFLLRPASGLSAHFNSDNDQRNMFHSEFFPNSIDDGNRKAVSAGLSNDGPSSREFQKLVQFILEMFGSQAENSKPFTNKDREMHQGKDEFTQTEIPDSLPETIIPDTTGAFPSLPSPTQATPTKNNLDDINSTPRLEQTLTKMRFKVKMSVKDNGNNNDKGSDNIESSEESPANWNPVDATTEPSDHLNHMWTSSLPILMKNNKASLFSKPDFDDMSKILPVLPEFLNKLTEVHKHGHLTIMMMNLKHMPVDTEVVDKTNICCEMRQQLLHTMRNVPTDDQPSPPLPDEEVSPELKNFFPSLRQYHTPEVPETSSFEDEHHGVKDADSPWNEEEKSIVSQIIDHLHLFDQPGHLSAVSFNPRHIIQKKNPTLLHIQIRIHLPTEGSSDSDGFNSPIFNGNNDPEPLYPVDYNTDDSMEPMPLLSPSSFEQPELYSKLKLHRMSRVTVHEYPLNNFHDSFGHSALPLPAPMKASKKRMTIFYFIIHHHHVTKEQSTPAPNVQTLLRDIFNIPYHTSFNEDLGFPQEDDFYQVPHQEFREDPFVGSSESIENSGQIGEDSRQDMSPPDILSEIIKRVNEDQFSHQRNGLSSEDLFPGHSAHMRPHYSRVDEFLG